MLPLATILIILVKIKSPNFDDETFRNSKPTFMGTTQQEPVGWKDLKTVQEVAF